SRSRTRTAGSPSRSRCAGRDGRELTQGRAAPRGHGMMGGVLHRSDHRRTQRRASLAAVLTATAALVVLPACSDETPRVAAPTAPTTTPEPAPPDPAGPAPQALLDQCPAITELHDDLRGGALFDSATIGPVVRAFAQALHDHAY